MSRLASRLSGAAMSTPAAAASALQEVAPAVGAEIRLLGISKAFGAQRVLQALNLTVKPGEFLAVVGRSGCGKSTLLRLMAGLDLPDSGTIALGKPSQSRAREQAVRVMFQDPRLLPWKRVLDNVGIGARGFWEPQALQALQDAGLAARAHEWPSVLSGGQQQRVALARALMSRPQVLLLDEPLGALDALTRLEMQKLLEKVWLRQRFTAVLVTHDVREAVTLADRVVLLEDGSVTLIQPIHHARPRPLGDPELGGIEAHILSRLLEAKG